MPLKLLPIDLQLLLMKKGERFVVAEAALMPVLKLTFKLKLKVKTTLVQ